MAQAARLNLRLQKELKLLLTDPPYGASFPNLSTSSSLTTIDAQIKGPEGTVYSDGLFNIKIQIPDRYPFQPPSVTFATPIYHPNIDTGGRICLDILNLPPKGAWQPSLNISTVLTSIGLLLSEPNPDDGLMCEASREFKYNRQAFDQKARSMTEKYARSSVHSLANPSTVQMEVETVNHESKHQENESVVKLEGELTNGDVKHDLKGSLVHKKLFGNSKKLSLVSSVSSHKRDAHKEGCEVQSASEKLIKDEPTRCSQSQEKLGGSRRKLSLGALSQSQNKSDINMVDIAPNHCPSVEPQNLPVQFSGSLVPLSGDSSKQGFHVGGDGTSVADSIKMRSRRLCQSGNKQSFGSLDTPQMISEDSDEMIVTPQIPPSQSHTKELSEPLPVVPDVNSVKRQPHNDVNGYGNGSTDTSRKRLCLGGKKLSLGVRGSSQMGGKDNKENVVPPQVSEDCGSSSKSGGEIASHKKSGIVQPEGNNSNVHPHSKSLPKQHQDFNRAEKHQTDKECIAPTGTIKQKKAEEPALFQPEGVIVLDSEDSEEEKTAPAKSKPVLARKRLGKWRVRT